MVDPDIGPDEHDAHRIAAAIPLVALGFFASQGLDPADLLVVALVEPMESMVTSMVLGLRVLNPRPFRGTRHLPRRDRSPRWRQPPLFGAWDRRRLEFVMSVHAASSHWIPPTPQRGAQATRPWHTRLLQYSSYPLILGVNVGLAIYAVMAGLSLGPIMVWLGLGNLLGFGLLEWLIPYRRDWRPSGRDLLRDLEYMLSVAMFITVTQVLLGVIAVAIAPGGNDLPLWLAVPLAVALADLIAYGYHRLIHTNAWLWKEHGVHHAPDKINVYMGNVLHVIDVLASGLLTMIPLIALGFSAEAIFLANVISTVQGVGSHTNADVRLGALNWFIMGPEHHRLHHSIVVEEAGNYAGVLTLWDRLFGTFTWAPKRRPDAVGVSADQAFPDSHRYLASLVHPFVKTRTR